MITAVVHAFLVLSAALTAGVWPLDPQPRVVEGFSPPATTWGPGHRGVDLLGHPGQEVRAAEAGTVAYAGRLAGRGVVVVSHGATRTTYEPVTASVAVGQRVRAGAAIGRLELFGSHCFPRSCLHWGLIEAGTYLDPLSLVGDRPVRLLPLYSDLPAGLPVLVPAVPAVAATPVVAAAVPAVANTTAWVRFARPAGGPADRPDAAGPW